jgi:hypothetical protein
MATRQRPACYPAEPGVKTFLDIALYMFAGFAVLGMLPASVLAAKERKPAMALIALLIAAFVIYVLVASALMLSHG